MSVSRLPPILLDCTIRDGNYAVDFKFTEADTTLLTRQLADLGHRWIEVGHGLGLGAMEAGKGDMPASDRELIHAARLAQGDAKIGMFFIPGVGRKEHLDQAHDAGLDFVRIGDNAPEIERALPFVAHARSVGLIPCVNMMKSYGVTPEEFALKAKRSVEAGAEVVYFVDSAGSVLPDTVASYFDATRAVVACELGFHGHNNLMLVIANCLAAYEHGVRFLDTTLCGIGRSAGNAPTEILVAVMERLGIPTGLDLFRIMDVIESYMWPLVGQTRAHDMMAVASGYSQFHSSFLPKVAAVARKHHVELRRLVVQVAQHDPVNIDEKFLEQAARELANSDTNRVSEALISFSVPGLSPLRLSYSLASTRALLDGLVVASAKRAGTRVVLQLVPTAEPIEDFLLPEFVLDDSQVVMGRVQYGSFAVLKQVLELCRPHTFLYLVNQTDGWAADALKVVNEIAGLGRGVPVRDEQIRQLFLLEALDWAAQHSGADALLVYCPDEQLDAVLAAGTAFKTVFVYRGQRGSEAGHGQPGAAPSRVVTVTNLTDWHYLKLQFNVIVCGANPLEGEAQILGQSLAPEGRLLTTRPGVSSTLIEAASGRLMQLDLKRAYAGFLARQIALDNMLGEMALEPA